MNGLLHSLEVREPWEVNWCLWGFGVANGENPDVAMAAQRNFRIGQRSVVQL